MEIKGIIFEDFINYKLPCMTIEFPYCSWKCDKECGRTVCQNSKLAKARNYTVSIPDIVGYYLKNEITQAICFQGLEPFDSPEWLDLVHLLRFYTDDPIIIYTGYTEEELQSQIALLSQYKNIIVKFGRYIPDRPSYYDEVLGVYLASSNQYAKEIGRSV